MSSGDEYEERESDVSDEEYEQEDDYRLGMDFLAPNAKAQYENNWTEGLVPNQGGVRYQKDEAQPGYYWSEREAFEAIMSPGIINL